MGLAKDFFSNTCKPEGLMGEFMVRGMNGGHAELAAWGSQFVNVMPWAHVLDVGCGGGANVQNYLMGCDSGRVDGVDYSEVSVAAARKLNRRAIIQQRCAIEQASVESLPFEDGAYDFVSAFETVYFWPNLVESFAEVARVLKPGGRFLVVNESTGSDASSEFFAGIIDGMSLYSADELARIMQDAGFADVVIHRAEKKPWISVVGTKPGGQDDEQPAATILRDAGPDYANWVPLGMTVGALAGTGALVGGAVATAVTRAPKPMSIALGALGVGCGVLSAWCVVARDRFSYNGARKLSRQIVEGTASHVRIPEGGTCLDVGCGSGALSIAVARRNPHAKVLGVDCWGPEYKSYSKALCERNAAVEGVSNASFQRGDATALPFQDESFDAVTSNYVYHNITGRDKQALLRETLRCLKKGGSFALHDLMSPMRYGDMKAFCQSLRDEGYQDVRLVPTDDGIFMSKTEATYLMLGGSMLLVGTK